MPALPGACVIVGLYLREWARTINRQRFAGALATVVLIGSAWLATSSTGIALAERDSARALFAATHARGLDGVRVANFGTLSRAAEFYAARDLLYGADGDPLRLETPAQVEQLTVNEPLLLLIPTSKRELLDVPKLRVEAIAGNGVTQLVLVNRAALSGNS